MKKSTKKQTEKSSRVKGSFGDLISISNPGNPAAKKTNVQDKIHEALKTSYDTKRPFTTSITWIVQAVTNKYPLISKQEVLSALGNMQGYDRTGDSLSDSITFAPF
jgi:hypothetical protein